jgi:5'-3' exonuclease
MTGKYTLIFDGNFWLHKTYFIGQKIKQGKPFNFIEEPEEDKNLLLWKLALDFSAEIKRFEGITNRIVYTIDSSSWRKKFLDSQYKANRTKSSDIDWGKIYEVHDEFVKALEAQGITISRIRGAEADDLIFAWSSFLNQQEQNTLIISGDNDLLQLCNMDRSSNANTLYYNKFDKNIHTFQGFKTWLEEDDKATTGDIFNMPVDIISNTKIHLRDIIRKGKMKIDEVNTNEFIFKKVLTGDAGDNVPPLYSYIKETKGGLRNYKVTPNQANKVLDKFKENRVFVNQSHLFSEETITDICEIAKEIIKIPEEIQEIKDKWKLNRDLVYLHKSCIPKEINDLMFTQVEERFKQTLSGSDIHNIMNKDNILKESSYTPDGDNSFNDSSIFRSSMKSNKTPKESNVTIKKETDSKGFDDTFLKGLL